jgi:phosphoglycolate phosphatase
MNEPLRLAVFDCDGTLVDSQHSNIAAVRTACEAHRVPAPAPDTARRLVGLPLDESFSRLVPGADEETCIRLGKSYRDAYSVLRLERQVEEPLYPGAAEGLKALADCGWLLGVATGKSLRGLSATLTGHNLEGMFATLQTPDEARGKPHPEMLFKAMNETGAEAAMTIMIGDTTYDMEMAQSAGTLAVGVAWGYHEPAELQAAGADCIVEGFADLPRALAALLDGKAGERE